MAAGGGAIRWRRRFLQEWRGRCCNRCINSGDAVAAGSVQCFWFMCVAGVDRTVVPVAVKMMKMVQVRSFTDEKEDDGTMVAGGGGGCRGGWSWWLKLGLGFHV